jgi:molybdenum cofactor cytidylyltransferase
MYYPPMVPAVILAAGKSTRMGRSKATLPLGEADTFLTRIVRTLRDGGVEDVVLVVGHEPQPILESLETLDLPLRIVMNADYESGQFSSVLAGLREIDRPGVTGMMLTLVDVPLISAATVRAVLERHRQSGAPVVRPVSYGRHGHPIVIHRSLFPLVRSADPAQGLKPVVRANVSVAGDVEVEDEGAFTDVDTPEEYGVISRNQESPMADTPDLAIRVARLESQLDELRMMHDLILRILSATRPLAGVLEQFGANETQEQAVYRLLDRLIELVRGPERDRTSFGQFKRGLHEIFGVREDEHDFVQILIDTLRIERPAYRELHTYMVAHRWPVWD